jgi:hypothetical protein
VTVNSSISPIYFKNEMTWKELESTLNAMGENKKRELNNLRLLMYSTFQSQSTKRLKPTDVMEFEWDVKEKIDIDNIIDKDEALNIINSLKIN